MLDVAFSMMGLLITVYLFLQLLHLINNDVLKEIMRLEELIPPKLGRLQSNLALIAMLIGVLSIMNLSATCAPSLTKLVLCI